MQWYHTSISIINIPSRSNMILNCSKCNRDFQPKFWASTRRMPKYCSRQCMALAFSKYPIIKICQGCNKEFKYYGGSKGKVCSLRCIKGNSDALKKYYESNPRKSFWKNATPSEKLDRYKQLFEDSVIKSEGCWGWKNYSNISGSGRIGVRGNFLSAYRASWLIYRGEIPKGLLVLHKCHNRVCSNPDHLYLGTHKDNTQDMLRAGRGNRSRKKAKSAKLDREKALEIKKLLKDRSLSQYEIAKRFTVSRSTILDILRGKSWKDV